MQWRCRTLCPGWTSWTWLEYVGARTWVRYFWQAEGQVSFPDEPSQISAAIDRLNAAGQGRPCS